MRVARVAPEKTVPPAVLPRAPYRSALEKRMKLSYAEQLRHPNWQRRRLERLEVARFMCECCGSGEKTLHVHHNRYIKGRLAWEYGDDDLLVLCEECHAHEHLAQQQFKDILEHSLLATGEAVAIIGGFCVLRNLPDDLLESAWAHDPESFESAIIGFLAYLLPRRQRIQLAEHVKNMLDSDRWSENFENHIRQYFQRGPQE